MCRSATKSPKKSRSRYLIDSEPRFSCSRRRRRIGQSDSSCAPPLRSIASKLKHSALQAVPALSSRLDPELPDRPSCIPGSTEAGGLGRDLAFEKYSLSHKPRFLALGGRSFHFSSNTSSVQPMESTSNHSPRPNRKFAESSLLHLVVEPSKGGAQFGCAEACQRIGEGTGLELSTLAHCCVIFGSAPVTWSAHDRQPLGLACRWRGLRGVHRTQVYDASGPTDQLAVVLPEQVAAGRPDNSPTRRWSTECALDDERTRQPAGRARLAQRD